jgi:hypothetical protein
MIKSSIKEDFTSNDHEMVAMRSHMFRQASVSMPPSPQGQMVPLLEDRPRWPIDDVKEMMHVQLSIPFGRSKKIVMADGVVHPTNYIPEIF